MFGLEYSVSGSAAFNSAFAGLKMCEYAWMWTSGWVGLSTQVLPEWKRVFLYPERWKVNFVEFERERPEFKAERGLGFGEFARSTSGFDECLLVDSAGFVRDGNFEFGVADSKWSFADASRGCFAWGGMGFLLECAERAGLLVELKRRFGVRILNLQRLYFKQCRAWTPGYGASSSFCSAWRRKLPLFIQSKIHA